MNKILFVLLAFVIGEIFTIFFLLPILTEVYEPLKTLAVPLPVLVWVILFLIIPTIVGGAIEGAFLAFFNKFWD